MVLLNILVSLNAGYLHHLIVMLVSLLDSNPDSHLTVYVLHRSLTEEDFSRLRRIDTERCVIVPTTVPEGFLSGAPTTGRYPIEMYLRLFAARLLPPDLDRILYLDPDLVVINPIDALYQIELDNFLFAAASHTADSIGMQKINELRLSLPEGVSYVNSGVMMMNLALLREQQDEREVFEYIESHKLVLMLPDQDVLNAVYGSRIRPVDTMRYNLSERVFGLYNLRPENWEHPLGILWVEQHGCIIHYCGKNKPWNPNYLGEFDRFYLRYERMAKEAGLL